MQSRDLRHHIPQRGSQLRSSGSVPWGRHRAGVCGIICRRGDQSRCLRIQFPERWSLRRSCEISFCSYDQSRDSWKDDQGKGTYQLPWSNVDELKYSKLKIHRDIFHPGKINSPSRKAHMTQHLPPEFSSLRFSILKLHGRIIQPLYNSEV